MSTTSTSGPRPSAPSSPPRVCRTITEVRAVVLSAAQLSALLIEQPELAVAMVKRLSRQMRELTERYAVRGEELKARLVQLLRTNAAETGDPTFRSTREELSNWVGATREAVTRTLSEMESEGVVSLRRGAVELLGV